MLIFLGQRGRVPPQREVRNRQTQLHERLWVYRRHSLQDYHQILFQRGQVQGMLGQDELRSEAHRGLPQAQRRAQHRERRVPCWGRPHFRKLHFHRNQTSFIHLPFRVYHFHLRRFPSVLRASNYPPYQDIKRLTLEHACRRAREQLRARGPRQPRAPRRGPENEAGRAGNSQIYSSQENWGIKGSPRSVN